MSQYHGIPKAVGKQSKHAGLPDAGLMRESWLLELLGVARHDRLPAKLDLHGHRATRPPCILNLPDTWLALDLLAALRDLRSRPRAFSQQAGRYAELARGATDDGRKLVLELVDPDDEPTETDHKLADALAKYLNAEITLLGPSAIARELHGLKPDADLQDRNPLAWALALRGPA